jgi:Ca2+-transporting ATPase
MKLPPRDPNKMLANRQEMVRWAIYGGALFLVTLGPLLFGPDVPSAKEATASMTMAFVVMSVGTLLTGLSVRRDPTSGLTPPILKAAGILAVSGVLTVFATQASMLQHFLMTQSLTGYQWLVSIALGTVVLVVIETEKLIRRHRIHQNAPIPVKTAVEPARVTTGVAGPS